MSLMRFVKCLIGLVLSIACMAALPGAPVYAMKAGADSGERIYSLASFTNRPARLVGMAPTDVAIGPNGVLYIADHLANRVVAIPSDGMIRTIAGTGIAGFSGDGGRAVDACLNQPMSVAVGLDGTIYVGDSKNHRIRAIAPDGIIRTVAGTGTAGCSGNGGLATLAQIHTPADLAVGPDGVVYLADAGNRTIRGLGRDGVIRSIAGTGEHGSSGDGGPSLLAQFMTPAGIAVGKDHTIYVADVAGQRVRALRTTGLIETVAGTGVAGTSGDGGEAIRAQLEYPQGLEVGPDGTIYIANLGSRCVRAVGTDGKIKRVAGAGAVGDSGTIGEATRMLLMLPSRVAVGPDGFLYIADTAEGLVRAVDTNGLMYTIAGKQADRSNRKWSIRLPASVAQGSDGTTYFADVLGRQIWAISPDGVLRRFAGTGEEGSSGDGGRATEAKLVGPTYVAVDPSGMVYIVDDDRVSCVGPDGIIQSFAGLSSEKLIAAFAPMFGEKPTNADAAIAIGDDGKNLIKATVSCLQTPASIAFGPDGTAYIVELAANRVRAVGRDGMIRPFAGSGVEGSGGDGGHATVAELNMPHGVAVATDGTVYISELGSHSVRAVDPLGKIRTVAGTGSRGYSGDGMLATNAQLDTPGGMSVGGDGTLFIADSGNKRVRAVSRDGYIRTVAGTGVEGLAREGGLAARAQLAKPVDVAVGVHGELFIADNDNGITVVCGPGRLRTRLEAEQALARAEWDFFQLARQHASHRAQLFDEFSRSAAELERRMQQERDELGRREKRAEMEQAHLDERERLMRSHWSTVRRMSQEALDRLKTLGTAAIAQQEQAARAELTEHWRGVQQSNEYAQMLEHARTLREAKVQRERAERLAREQQAQQELLAQARRRQENREREALRQLLAKQRADLEKNEESLRDAEVARIESREFTQILRQAQASYRNELTRLQPKEANERASLEQALEFERRNLQTRIAYAVGRFELAEQEFREWVPLVTAAVTSQADAVQREKARKDHEAEVEMQAYLEWVEQTLAGLEVPPPWEGANSAAAPPASSVSVEADVPESAGARHEPAISPDTPERAKRPLEIAPKAGSVSNSHARSQASAPQTRTLEKPAPKSGQRLPQPARGPSINVRHILERHSGTAQADQPGVFLERFLDPNNLHTLARDQLAHRPLVDWVTPDGTRIVETNCGIPIGTIAREANGEFTITETAFLRIVIRDNRVITAYPISPHS